MTVEPADVLVVGAGPTGLALALQLHAHGASVRVIERRTGVFRPSRALVMHPRTLELLRPLGVTGALVARGDPSPSVQLHLGSRVVPVRFADLSLHGTAFPHLLMVRQSDVEAVLSRALAERGVVVERGVELVDLTVGPQGVRATVTRDGSSEERVSTYVAGCDGAGSTVRGRAGVPWRGGPYAQEVVLADLELDGDVAPGMAHAVSARRGLLFLFAIGEHATWRMLATRPAGSGRHAFGQPGSPVPEEELRELLAQARLPARITEVAWSAQVRLQHRMAARFRRGPVFLAGDAAHAHSPAAAQGMNTGIHDAMNLGWKLACAARAGRVGTTGTWTDTVLDSYESERRPVDRRVLALTHLVFWAEAGGDPVASFARGVMAPLAAPAVPFLLRRRRLVTIAMRTLSQFWVHYRDSALTVEGSPRMRSGPRAGDRLPDAVVTCEGRPVRLHDVLVEPGMHVLLQADAPDLDPDLAGPYLRVHRLSSWPGAGVLVVRPDGHVGFRSGAADSRQVRDWLALVGAAPG